MTSLAGWDDVRRIADEVELQVHLGGMDARDRWHGLETRLVHLEKSLAHSGDHAGEALVRELSEIRTGLVELRDKLVLRTHGDYVTGW
jgi:hypothetical protein